MEVLGLLKPSLQDFKHDLTSMGDKCDCLMVSTFFGTTLLGEMYIEGREAAQTGRVNLSFNFCLAIKCEFFISLVFLSGFPRQEV